jgi:aspartate racemase
MRLIGLIGGLGPAATVFYYQALVSGAARRGDPLRLLLNHAEVARVLDLAGRNERLELGDYLLRLALELDSGGAELFALTGVTPHLAADSLRAAYGDRFVGVVEVINARLERDGSRKAVLLGTRAVMHSELFGHLACETAQQSQSELDQAHELYVSIVQTQVATPETTQAITALARSVMEREQADAVVLAGTELSLIEPAAWGGLPVIDAGRLHVEALLNAAL